MKQMKWLFWALPVLMLTACTTSKVTSSWRSPEATKALTSFKNILVVGMQPENRFLKEEMENYLAEYLKKNGVNATASFDVFGPKAFANLSEDDIASRLKNKGYDGVMTIALLDREKEENYVPGNLNYAPIGPFYSRFGLYYSNMYNRLYTPGYYTTSTSYYWETNLYDARKDKLIYSAQSALMDPGSATSMSKEHGKLIVNDLEKKGFIAKR